MSEYTILTNKKQYTYNKQNQSMNETLLMWFSK